MLQLRETNNATAVKLEQQIIIADCQVLAAIINFLHQDWGSYMKGGWVLRKAWKIYQKSYAQIRHLYIKRIGLGGNSIGMLRISSNIIVRNIDFNRINIIFLVINSLFEHSPTSAVKSNFNEFFKLVHKKLVFIL